MLAHGYHDVLAMCEIFGKLNFHVSAVGLEIRYIDVFTFD